MTDALVVTLASDLEHAATALDVVDDEARQHIASLLSPKARQLLAVLTAADHAPPPPTAVTAPPIAVAPPSASALPPTNDSADERPTARPRPASGLQAFPEDVLGGIVSFVDLPMRFTCVVACGAMRDAAARLSPRLEHALVLRRYPMLATIGSSPTAAPAPRDLLRAYERIFRRRRSARPRPTTTLDDYTLSLELDLTQAVPPPEGVRRRSLWIGTGAFSGDDEATFEFTVPDDLFATLTAELHKGWDLEAKVMVSRRTGGGRVQMANLFDGGVEEYGNQEVIFDWSIVPHDRRNKALHWLNPAGFAVTDNYLWNVPKLFLTWPVWTPKLKADFMMRNENGLVGMSRSEACMTLEHYVEWSK